MADWEEIKSEYITKGTSYRKLADKYGIHYKTIADRGKDEGWKELRSQHSHNVLTKMLECDTEQKVDRAARLMTVADKLLRKVEMYVEGDGLISPTSAKNLSDALKNIKEVQMIRSEKDLQEQDARIAKLRKEAEKEEQNHDVTITIEGGEASWQS